MANLCSYWMKVKGKKSDIRELVKWMNAEYDTKNNYCSEKHHFYKMGTTTTVSMFESLSEYADEEEIVIMNLLGQCSWSVRVCMVYRESVYYKQGDDKGITLQEASKLLNLDIEVISEELGMNFTEHILIIDGNIIEDSCTRFFTDEEMEIYTKYDDVRSYRVYDRRCDEVYVFNLYDYQPPLNQ